MVLLKDGLYLIFKALPSFSFVIQLVKPIAYLFLFSIAHCEIVQCFKTNLIHGERL